jgi:hypothetical protein
MGRWFFWLFVDVFWLTWASWSDFDWFSGWNKFRYIAVHLILHTNHLPIYFLGRLGYLRKAILFFALCDEIYCFCAILHTVDTWTLYFISLFKRGWEYRVYIFVFRHYWRLNFKIMTFVGIYFVTVRKNTRFIAINWTLAHSITNYNCMICICLAILPFNSTLLLIFGVALSPEQHFFQISESTKARFIEIIGCYFPMVISKIVMIVGVCISRKDTIRCFIR